MVLLLVFEDFEVDEIDDELILIEMLPDDDIHEYSVELFYKQMLL